MALPPPLGERIIAINVVARGGGADIPMSALVTGLGGVLAYMACALFYQAGERRTAVVVLNSSQQARAAARAAAWAALLAALWLFAQPHGWERGVAIWIGAVSAAGILSMLISALRPGWHVASGAAAGAGAIVLAAAATATGAAG